MELFQFVEHSFDINLINKCKNGLGIKNIKKINKTLNELVLSDTPTNDLRITVAKEKENDDGNRLTLNELEDSKVITEKNSLDYLNYEKENTISSSFIDDDELFSN